jgi:RNA polymerase sigma-70 factor (ECF subfamily)
MYDFKQTGTDTALFPEMIDWEAALCEHESWLKTVIGARVGESAAVEEVWQEVSLAAIKQQSPIHDTSRVTPWLYQLAVRQSLLYRRKMGRRRKLVERYVERVMPVTRDHNEPNPLDVLLADERHEQVHEALKTLSEQDREILLLKYVHEWSYRDMAENLGLTISAIQARLHRARQRLRDTLTGDTPGNDEP